MTMKTENSKYHALSVLIPVYNVEDYLPECLESVLNQSMKDMEIILVDDGSTDGSGDICDRYRQHDNRIRVIHKENGGSVSARKTGLENAYGEYVVFLDSDDYIEKDAYENMTSYMKDQNVDFTAYGYWEGDNCIRYPENYIFRNEKCDDPIKEFFWGSGNHDALRHALWSKIYRRDFITGCFGSIPDHVQLGEDILCFWHCLMQCRSFAVRAEEYYHYRILKGSLSHRSAPEVIGEYWDLYNAMVEVLDRYDLQDENRRMTERFFLDHVNRTIRDHTGIIPLIDCWQFPHAEELHGKSVYIYGAGKVGEGFLRSFSIDSRITVKGVIDKVKAGERKGGHIIRPVGYVSELGDKDLIVVAILDEETAVQAVDEIAGYIDRNRIIWKKPQRS